MVPTFEKEINILNIPVDKLQVFSKEKTLPTFNINEEKNTFTIHNIMPKVEPKFFDRDNMKIDNVFKNEIHMKQSKIEIEKEKPIEKEKEKEKVIEKEIIYLPMKDTKFKRLRRSKRTKETYFTIKPNINKKNENILGIEAKEKEKEKYDAKKELSKTNENSFIIKNEYYYIESNDNKIPEIIEKQIKETIIVNKPSKEINSFTDNKVIFSNEVDFSIKADKNKAKDIHEEIQNDLDTKHDKLRDKNKKDKKIINKNEEFVINGEKKTWDDLNPIAIDEFSYRNENESENDMEEINENEGFQDNQNIYSDDNINYGKFDIIPNYQFEIINNKNEPKELVESKQNTIKLDGINIIKEDKELQTDIKQFNITTKKIVKKEQILSRKKFIHNKIASSDSFSMQGNPNENIIYDTKENDNEDKEELKEVIKYVDNKKELILVKENIDEFSYKKTKTYTKENETEAKPLNHFNEIMPILANEFNIRNKKIKMKEEGTEITDELKNNLYDNYNYNRNEIKLENIRSENIMIKGKKKKMKESETEIDEELNNIQPYQNEKKIKEESTEVKEENSYIIKNDNFDIFAPEKELEDKEKKQIVLEESKIDEINLESRRRFFPKLDINNYLYETFDGKEKKRIEFEQSKNESIMLEPNEDKKEILEKEKEKEYIIENNQMSIVSEEKKKELHENDEPKINDEELLKSFNALTINKSEEYNIFGKEKEENEEKEEKKKRKIKMKESETQVDDDLLLNDIQKSNNSLLNEDNNELIDEQKEEKPRKLRGRKDKNEDMNVIESYELAIKGLEKEKIELEEEKIEQVNYESTEQNKEDSKIFSNLEIYKCDEQILYGNEKKKIILQNMKNDNIIINGKEREALENIKKDSILINGKEREALENIQKDSIIINGKEKEEKVLENIKNEPIAYYGKEMIISPKIFESIKNEPITIKPNKRKGTEIGTQIDNDLNYNLVDCNNEAFTFESINPRKKELILGVEEQQSINKKEKEPKREFNKDDISICFSENFAVKLKEDYEMKTEEASKLNKNINILEESIEKRIEIIGNPSVSNKDNNDGNGVKESKLNAEYPIDSMNDIEPHLKEELINNIVQDKLEKEKQKTMDQTKNKLIQVVKIIKLRNALGKNLKNKKDFINKLKDIKKNKEKKNIFSPVNAINHNYLSKNNKKVEESTDTENLDKIYENANQKIKNVPLDIVKNNEIAIINNEKKLKLERIDLDKETNNLFTILRKKKKKSNDMETEITDELNKIELVQNDKFSLLTSAKEKKNEKKPKKAKEYRKNISMQLPSMEIFMEGKESDLNISGISKDTVDRQIQIEPTKKSKATTKKIAKEEIMTKKKFSDVKCDRIDSFQIIFEYINKEKDKDKLGNISIKKATTTVGTQTPKLRPANKSAQKVVFHETKSIIKKEQKPVNQFEISRASDFELLTNKKVSKLFKEIKGEEYEENEKSDGINT